MRFQSQGDGDEVPVCFATSYEWCHRYFEIDLEKAGVEGWVMDVIRPIITVRERCACRKDCGAVYELKLQLLRRDENYDKNVLLPRFPTHSRFWGQWEGGDSWETVEHVYSDYPCGMRKLAVMSRGKDSQYWAGHYGAKFGATEVIITFPDDPRELSPEDFPDEEKKLLSEPSHWPIRSLRVPVGLRGRFPGRRGH
ncbi:F-box associated region [Teladorsagia circumcincta]|uniref:F-box associated region n=1 Tax=Teladorsagia circumcincta TaxID=45464 RepID=A0A2G9TS00_TELCI|nr:F-box associated region [Teladorsagia circumcincta]